MYACLSPAFPSCCEFCKTSHSCFVCFYVCCMWTCIWAWEQYSMLHPSEVPADHVLFIQSASVNRHVLPGVKLLLINKGTGTGAVAPRKKPRHVEPSLYDPLK